MYLSLKEGEGVARKKDGCFDTLWRSEHLEKIFCDHGFDVLESSRNISAVDTGDVWLGYVLTLKRGSENV